MAATREGRILAVDFGQAINITALRLAVGSLLAHLVEQPKASLLCFAMTLQPIESCRPRRWWLAWWCTSDEVNDKCEPGGGKHEYDRQNNARATSEPLTPNGKDDATDCDNRKIISGLIANRLRSSSASTVLCRTV